MKFQHLYGRYVRKRALMRISPGALIRLGTAPNCLFWSSYSICCNLVVYILSLTAYACWWWWTGVIEPLWPFRPLVAGSKTVASCLQESNHISRDGWEGTRQGSEVTRYIFKSSHMQLSNIAIKTNFDSDSITQSDNYSIPQLLNRGPLPLLSRKLMVHDRLKNYSYILLMRCPATWLERDEEIQQEGSAESGLWSEYTSRERPKK